ncbi:hypothetical protein HYU89_03455 [Candidatus Collierbacteria bacterium]|nr:hypothetical protein [Candidatus Collierbacteria bacterium]
MKINKLHAAKIFLAGILVLGLTLRLVYLREWFHFEFDEEVIAWKLRQFIITGKPFLIGGGTPFGFHLGPAFYYLSAIPLFFSRLDPIGWGVAAAVFGTVSVWLMWFAGKTLYNQRIGLIAALIWATSFTTVMTDRHWWPLVLDPMLSLLVILCLYKICVIPAKAGIYLNRFRVKHGMTWIALGLTLAFAWQADLTVLPLFLAAVVVAIRNWLSQKREVTITVLILLVSVMPLVLFEFRHPGVNLGKLIQRSSLPVGGLDLYTLSFIPQSLSRLLFPISHPDGNLLKFYGWCKDIADIRVNSQPWWAGGMTLLILATPFLTLCHPEATKGGRRISTEFFLRRWRSQNDGCIPAADRILRIMILSGVVGIFIFRLWGGNLYDFYLAVLYPVVLLLTARVVDFIWKKWGRIVTIAGLGIIVGLNLLIIIRAHHPQGLAIKRQAVAWVISNVKKEEFDLESISNCSRYNGVRFLFWLAGKEPQQSFVDPELSWLYDKKGDYMKPKFLVTFTTPNDLTPDQKEKYNQLKLDAVNSEMFSPDLEVIISAYD